MNISKSGPHNAWIKAIGVIMASLLGTGISCRNSTSLANVPLTQQTPAQASTSAQTASAPQKSAADYNKEGYEAGNAKNFKKMETAYRNAVRLEPSNALYNSLLGMAFEKQGKYSDAEAAYRKAVHLKPNESENHANLGGILTAEKKYREAERECRNAVRLAPNDSLTHESLGLALEMQKNTRVRKQSPENLLDLRNVTFRFTRI